MNVLSKHQTNPTDNEWNMLQRVVRYLIGTKGKKLVFRGKTNALEAFADASFSDCKGSLTTCGHVIRLFGDSVAWCTRKQQSVALSTCQAEYVTISEACKALRAISQSISLICSKEWYPMNLYSDSKSAIACAKTDGNTAIRAVRELIRRLRQITKYKLCCD